MKTQVPVDRVLERRILQLLVVPKSPGAVAQETGLTIRKVEEIATAHGHPNVMALEAALTWMDREDAKATDTASTGVTAGGRELRTVPVADIVSDPDNPREEITDVEELADSIRQVGLLQPIVCRQRAGQLIVVAGHRRLAAIAHLGWDHVDVVVTRDMRPDEVLAAMLIENGQRRDLDPIEEARAFARLKAMKDLTSLDLGRRLGRSQSFIDSRIRLLDLSPEDQAKVRTRQMGTTHGAAKARVLGGNVRLGGGRIPHLSVDHDLAAKARARCTREHNLKAALVGKTACGQCWESVIRTHERQLLAQAALGGTCATCGHTDPEATS